MFIKCVLEFAFCKRKGSTFYKPSITGDSWRSFRGRLRQASLHERSGWNPKQELHPWRGHQHHPTELRHLLQRGLWDPWRLKGEMPRVLPAKWWGLGKRHHRLGHHEDIKAEDQGNLNLKRNLLHERNASGRRWCCGKLGPSDTALSRTSPCITEAGDCAMPMLPGANSATEVVRQHKLPLWGWEQRLAHGRSVRSSSGSHDRSEGVQGVQKSHQNGLSLQGVFSRAAPRGSREECWSAKDETHKTRSVHT